jgi:hypothetical protein
MSDKPREVIGYLCGPHIYEYKGIVFEYSIYGGPWPLKKDGEQKKLAGRRFFRLAHEFFKLPESEQEKYRIGGGCRRIVANA